MQNIELKARLADLDRARRIAAELATQRLEPQHQIDTYFHCRSGRLKLRQIDGLAAQLIWYERPDREGPKASEYHLVPVSDAEALKAALAGALGIRTVVEKRREISLWHNVRIHLDEVVGLGAFLEFEAVLSAEVDEAAGRAQVEELIGRFGISSAEVLSGSYGEMASGVV
jgi:predicted adenylyl cyclase CyaB